MVENRSRSASATVRASSGLAPASRSKSPQPGRARTNAIFRSKFSSRPPGPTSANASKSYRRRFHIRRVEAKMLRPSTATVDANAETSAIFAVNEGVACIRNHSDMNTSTNVSGSFVIRSSATPPNSHADPISAAPPIVRCRPNRPSDENLALRKAMSRSKRWRKVMPESLGL